MIQGIMGAMLIAMNIWQNSMAVLLSSFAARRNVANVSPSYSHYYAHSEASGEGHGGFTDSIRSDQVWVEGSPEIAHYETRVLRDAWDEEVVTGALCASCGATK